tara:strand:+ start:1538 stop:2797 length:1260 start_codon:yes stop_codon:yes gene_type:complete
MTKARITTLKNGLRVVSEKMEGIETTSVGIWVDVGSRDENKNNNGVSHLLEHMAFKGTKKRSARAIAEEIEAVGGHLNAYTSREHTAYYAKVMSGDLSLALDMLSDILINSTFEEAELERERSVILQEIAQAQDTPDDQVFDFFQEVAYPDQALGRCILGQSDQVESYTRRDLMSYMDEKYSPHRMVISAAGCVEHERLVDLAHNKFGDLKKGADKNRDRAKYKGGEKIIQRDLEQVHFIFGFDGLAFNDKGFYSLQALSTLLGGGMSSRLFQEVREKRGLAYSVFTFTSAYVDGGTFGIYVGTGKNNLSELIPILSDQLNGCHIDIEQKELDRARAQLKAGILMSLESTFSRCERLARHLLIFGRPIPVQELLSNLNATSVKDIQDIAKDVMKKNPPSVAVLGPATNEEVLDPLRRNF